MLLGTVQITEVPKLKKKKKKKKKHPALIKV